MNSNNEQHAESRAAFQESATPSSLTKYLGKDVSTSVSTVVSTEVSIDTSNVVTTVVSNEVSNEVSNVGTLVKNATGRVRGNASRNEGVIYWQALRLIEAGVSTDCLIKSAVDVGVSEEVAKLEIAAAHELVADNEYLSIRDRVAEWEVRASVATDESYLFVIRALAENATNQLDMCPWLSLTQTEKSTGIARRTIARRLKNLEKAGLVKKQSNGKQANGKDHVSNFHLHLDSKPLWEVVTEPEHLSLPATEVITEPEQPIEPVIEKSPVVKEIKKPTASVEQELDDTELRLWWDLFNESNWSDYGFDSTENKKKCRLVSQYLSNDEGMISEEDMGKLKEGLMYLEGTIE